jgi:hypothetical protein
MSWSVWLKVAQVLQALLAPVVAIATVVIGILAVKIQRVAVQAQALAVEIQRQQATTNHRQFRLALFEKRMKVFNSTMELIGLVLRDPNIDLRRLFQFLSETCEVDLLFGPEVKEYINDVYRKGLELHTRYAVGGREDIEKATAVLEWFNGQSAEATKRFLKYLDFREP